jgi:alpha/beta superfamily hydrolase
LLQKREGSSAEIGALVCHPHPLYGGTMHNKVVHRLATTLMDLGLQVLRFNFRGAGKSAGRWSGGDGELEDARAALAYLREHAPTPHVWSVGFSFGSWIAARLADSERAIERLILVAPSVSRSDFGMLERLATPKLVLQGTADEVCPIAALDAAFATWAEAKRLVRIEGASHFFDRQLGDLSKALLQGLDATERGAT